MSLTFKCFNLIWIQIAFISIQSVSSQLINVVDRVTPSIIYATNGAHNTIIKNVTSADTPPGHSPNWLLAKTQGDETGFNMRLTLPSTNYAWLPDIPSNLTLLIDSNQELSPNMDLLLTFSIGTNQYFSLLLSLDNDFNNKISPPKSQALLTGNVYSIVNNASGTRRSKLGFGTSADYNLQPPNENGQDNLWPFTIEINNDPLHNEIEVEMYNQGAGINQFVSLSGHFATNEDTHIYIASDNANTDIAISHFDIQYSYEPTTGLPTSDPTDNRLQVPSPDAFPRLPAQTPSTNSNAPQPTTRISVDGNLTISPSPSTTATPSAFYSTVQPTYSTLAPTVTTYPPTYTSSAPTSSPTLEPTTAHPTTSQPTKDYGIEFDYYFSGPLYFRRATAAVLCALICNSTLASIHSDAQFQELAGLFNVSYRKTHVGDKVWIGPYFYAAQPYFVNADGTDWDYGTVWNPKGIYPWTNGQPSNQTLFPCIAVIVGDTADQDRWTMLDCDTPLPFVCNFCHINEPNTASPSTTGPTSAEPTTYSPTTSQPTTLIPSTFTPTTGTCTCTSCDDYVVHA